VSAVGDLSAQGYELRPLSLADAPGLTAAYARNRAHLEPWDPPRPPEFWTEAGQRARIAVELEAMAQGRQATWVVHHDGRIVGRVALNNIVHAAFRSTSMGYWVDAAHTGRGVATWAGEHACAEAVRLGLHRVEAGTLVHNTASQQVLRRLGFTLFGTAERYLFIAGEWQDHRLYQRILHDDPI
jgi:ribosomal-protein-alanine N-acetyltransferase